MSRSRRWRMLGGGLVATAVLSTLAGCTPGIASWAFLHDDGTVSFGLCQAPGSADAMRISYQSFEGTRFEELSGFAMSGPKVDFGESRAIDADAFPSSWIAAGDPGAAGDWTRTQLEIFVGPLSYEREFVDRDELRTGEWVLVNDGLGTMSCAEPTDEPFLEAYPGESVPAQVDPLESAEAVAMPVDQFWSIIEGARAESTSSQLGAIESALAGASVEEAIAFDSRLRIELYRLDSLENWNGLLARETRAAASAVTEEEYLRYRCALVLAGRDTPLAEDSDWETADGLQVLTLARGSHNDVAFPGDELAIGFRANIAGWQRAN